MSAIYTGGGDGGTTSLAKGGRVPKDDPRVEAYGSVDEACSVVGAARALSEDQLLRDVLSFVQDRLYRYAGMLAVAPAPGEVQDASLAARTDEDVAFLERAIDRFETPTGPLDQFILPGGCPLAAQLFVARAVVRRAERRVTAIEDSQPSDGESVRFLNRLSDALFAAARYANLDANRAEKAWDRDAGPPAL
jgi:cob(I)alamin adenosyltransferase